MTSGSVTQFLRRAQSVGDTRTPSLSRESAVTIQRRSGTLCFVYATAYAVAFLPGMFLIDLPYDGFAGPPEIAALGAIILALAAGLVLRRIRLSVRDLFRASIVRSAGRACGSSCSPSSFRGRYSR